jgi:hypothetical protein
MWHSLGIPHEEKLRDRLDRPFQLSDGRLLKEVVAA